MQRIIKQKRYKKRYKKRSIEEIDIKICLKKINKD